MRSTCHCSAFPEPHVYRRRDPIAGRYCLALAPVTDADLRLELQAQGWDDLALSAMSPVDMRAELDR